MHGDQVRMRRVSFNPQQGSALKAIWHDRHAPTIRAWHWDGGMTQEQIEAEPKYQVVREVAQEPLWLPYNPALSSLLKLTEVSSELDLDATEQLLLQMLSRVRSISRSRDSG